MEQTENNSTTKTNFEVATEAGLKGLEATGRFMTKLLDLADKIDRKLYGNRMRWFVIFSLLVVLGSPVIDHFRGKSNDTITAWTTFLFLLFLIVLFLSWIGAWREDDGSWNWKMVRFRLQIHFELFMDFFNDFKLKSRDEKIYHAAIIFIVSGFSLKALQNLSVFIRKPLQLLFGKIDFLRNFERFATNYFLYIMIFGFLLLIYLYFTNKKALSGLSDEFRNFFLGWDKSRNAENKADINIQVKTKERIINLKETEQVNQLLNTSDSKLFKNFVSAISEWKPRNCVTEKEFQYRLFQHLTRKLKPAKVETELPFENLNIPLGTVGRKKRGDIVINRTILVEMKRNVSAGEVQRAQGQISDYSSLWIDKGPVILLLCNYDYDKAKANFHRTMTDLVELKRPVLTLVAK